jgi:hypothetical protein
MSSNSILSTNTSYREVTMRKGMNSIIVLHPLINTSYREVTMRKGMNSIIVFDPLNKYFIQ